MSFDWNFSATAALTPFRIRTERFSCLPRAADRSGPVAGILERDFVVAVNGTPVSGHQASRCLLQAASEAAIGSPLVVDVRTGARPVRSYTLVLGGDEARPLVRLGLSYPFCRRVHHCS